LKLLLVLSAALLLVLFAACDDEASDPEVDVTLGEWSVVVDPETVTDGAIEFTVENDGEREHEFVIVRTDIAAADLPTEDDGSFNEDAPGVDVKEEIEDIEDGEKTGRTFDLEAGTYVFVCNRVEDIDGEETAHYGEGMFAEFEITEEE
jgi:hypothetical protein